MADWELTHELAKFLDRHLVFPLLEFLSGNEIYDERGLLEAKLALLNDTNMVDLAGDVYKELHNVSEPPAQFLEKRKKVLDELKQLEQAIVPIVDILTKEEVTQEMQKGRDTKVLLDYLQKNHGFTMDMVDCLLKFARFQYECGDYTRAGQFLSSHRMLVVPSDKNYLSNLWGKLACEILGQKWDAALTEFKLLREYIDNYPHFNQLELLQHRTWLIHWSLFIFFNHADGHDMLIEMFLEKKQMQQKQIQTNAYLNAVQTMCPHILRYLTTSVITHRKRREHMPELIKVIQQESYTYKDPVTEFVECLCVNFDFDGAQKKLRECVDFFENDFFLVALKTSFIENARLFIFEVFCQIHECISINMLAEKLNMAPEEAERWIVNLIRQAPLDAKIDSKLGHVVMGTQAVSPYHQLIEKSKAILTKVHLLTYNMEKKTQSQAHERAAIAHDF